MLRSLKKIGSMRSRKRSSSSETYTTPQQLTHTAPANITLVGGVELGGEGVEPEETSLDQLKIDALTLEVQALRARCALLEAENKKLAKEKSLAENALRLRGNEPQTQPQQPQSPTRVERLCRRRRRAPRAYLSNGSLIK